MKCLICGNECINKDKNICSNCSTSGLEYKENPPVRAKRISFDDANPTRSTIIIIYKI